MAKEKFWEFLRELLGGIKVKETTTYNEAGEVIGVETVTIRLSYFQIICKLFVWLMIVAVLSSLFINLYLAFFLQPRFSYFRPGSFIISMGFLMFFIWLHSTIGNED